MVDELTVECLNREAGCEFTCQRQLLAAHLKDECLFTEEQCSDPDCSRKALRKDILGDNSLCPHRPAVCDSCGTELKTLELGVSTLALIFPEYHCFSSARRRTSRHAPWRQSGALFAMPNICIQKLWLTPRCALLQLLPASKPPMAAIGRECA
jgi:hypothetical protein